jgi:threonine dehydrogenase-like Zn-dependent dehydrogenase
MKAIVVTDQAAGTAGMKLVERPEPQPSINDVVVQVYASGFVNTELSWPSTWTDRLDRDRTPSIPGHELAGVVTALGYGTTGLSVGERVFGLTDWYRDGTLAEYAAVETRNLAPLPDDVDFTVGASLPISGLTAWQGLFEHGRLRAGQRVIAHGAAGAVGSMVTQLARLAGAYVIGTGRAADRQKALDFGAQEFIVPRQAYCGGGNVPACAQYKSVVRSGRHSSAASNGLAGRQAAEVAAREIAVGCGKRSSPMRYRSMMKSVTRFAIMAVLASFQLPSTTPARATLTPCYPALYGLAAAPPSILP